ncbi:MAG: hypothetical protein K2X86_03215, partial [Cytophagaceae bacterium]|nr:hypothetical protein [Cytophagaceae bacterium]
MELNIKHTDSFASGAYILNKNRIPYSSFKECSTVFLTQENNTILKNEILKLINDSKDVLKICSFIITDKEVFDAILNKAQTTNTAIFVLTQLDQNKLINSFSLLDFLTEEEIKENTSQTHLKHIKKLFDNGVHVRASISAHAKFIVSDRKIGFITSANLTTPSLTFNTESGVYLDENDTLELDKLFDVIFQRGTGYRQFISSSKKNKMFVVQAEVKIDKDLLPNPTLSNLRYTYENETNNLFDEIIKIINEASEYLYISTYSIVGLTSINEFTQAISTANSRGVKIRLFCRGMNYRNDHLIGSSILHSKGCEIFADIFNHSKGIINENSGLIFTANIDGNHGLKNGFEIGYILNENQRLEFLEIHKHLIETGYYIYQSEPTRQELFQTYLTYELAKGINSPLFP